MTTNTYPRSTEATAKGRPLKNGARSVPCSRCGGKGGWDGWPGFTCYRCGGYCQDPTPETFFTFPEGWTVEECQAWETARAERLEANRRKRAEKKAAERRAIFEANVAACPALGEFEAARREMNLARSEDEAADLSGFAVYNAPGFLWDIADKAEAFDLSDAQRDAFAKAWTEHLARRAERQAEAEAAQPVPTGKALTLEGEVVSLKWKETPYGDKFVWVVKGADGWKVWGTVPSALRGGILDRGDRVRFVADVEASDEDETFGFTKRPRKAEVLEDATAAA